ncbi:transposase [Litorilinea aerophila]|uniref:Transposase n=1 Tax=Litorilinea aerophila TaxID=1204385 RepID=A0A540VA52_9CHLR|nr:transposase [Litorilinea aerophila]MCC9078454.1 transposase [Litorilinea aerophila]
MRSYELRLRSCMKRTGTTAMSIRRYYVPNSIVFITQVVAHRTPVFAQPAFVDLLREHLRKTQQYHPFVLLAYCFLPDHFHIMLRPTGNSTFSDIMHSLKPNFTKAYKNLQGISGNMKFWQKGFWDHVIRNEEDFCRHLDYIHYNPVHHGLVQRPEEWPHSSYVYWQARGAYPERWGWSLPASICAAEWLSCEADDD